MTIGSDIIEVGRIERLYRLYGNRFLKRFFTPKEVEYCLKHRDTARHLAGRFAAKEAIVKALGTGFRGDITWQGVEVVNNLEGKPIVILSEAIQQQFNHPSIEVSISHCKEYALAVALRTDKSS